MKKKQEIKKPQNLIPGSMVMIKLTGINWDWTSADQEEFGSKPNLPDDLIIGVEVEEVDDDVEEQLLDQAVEIATDQYGFCINSIGGSEIIGDHVVDVLVKVNVTVDGAVDPNVIKQALEKIVLDTMKERQLNGFFYGDDDLTEALSSDVLSAKAV
jgi:hypothetical protein